MTPTESAILSKGLPADPAMEAAVLGCCLLAGELPPEVSDGLSVTSFLLDKHQAIFRALLTLAEDRKPIGELELEAELRRVGELERAGGLAGIVDLTDRMPMLSRLPGYVEAVAEKARLRSVIEIAQAISQQALKQHDSAVEIADRGAALLMDLEQSGPSATEALTLRDVLGDPEARKRILDPHQNRRGITTGFLKLDEYTGGWKPGELIVIGARPSQGKTSLALSMAAAAAKEAPVLYATCESSREALFQRLVSQHSRVDWFRRRNGLLNDDEQRRVRASIAHLTQQPLHIADAAGATVERIAAIATRTKAKGGLGAVFVDYLQLLSASGKSENRTQEISVISRGLSRLAHELEVPVIALSQVSRRCEERSDPRPRLSDLRESGSIEQDADVVLFLFRPEVYKQDREDLHGLAELDIAKQRDGATGLVKLCFIAKLTKFENLVEHVADADDGGMFDAN